MSISKNSNCLDCTIEFRSNRKKQDKRLSNHHFSLRLPHQIYHNSGDSCFSASKCYSIKFEWVFGMNLIEGRGVKNVLGILNQLLQGFETNLYNNWIICRHGIKVGEIFGDWGGSSDLNKRNTRTQQSVIFQMVCSIRKEKK